MISTGKKHIHVRPDLSDDKAGWPVRVMKNAISDGVPYKDMLITPGHCLFFYNCFVPVRMLVNGVSIFHDKSFHAYDYYYLETNPHSVITSDGMLTESFLKTKEGTVIRSIRCQNQTYSFMLPPNTSAVRIISRANRPCDVIGPFIDDHHLMGVAVGEISLVSAKKNLSISSHLNSTKLDGWHKDIGWNGVAWTNGNALLPIDKHLIDGGIAILSLTIRAVGPYFLTNQKCRKGI